MNNIHKIIHIHNNVMWNWRFLWNIPHIQTEREKYSA